MYEATTNNSTRRAIRKAHAERARVAARVFHWVRHPFGGGSERNSGR